MNKAVLEFIVTGYVAGISGRPTVIGMCGERPIRVGDVFLVAFRAKHRAYPHEMGDPLVREIEHPVELRVEHIQAYGHCLEMLGEGMTGSLELSGAEAGSLGEGWTLITESNPKSAAPPDSSGITSHEHQSA